MSRLYFSNCIFSNILDRFEKLFLDNCKCLFMKRLFISSLKSLLKYQFSCSVDIYRTVLLTSWVKGYIKVCSLKAGIKRTLPSSRQYVSLSIYTLHFPDWRKYISLYWWECVSGTFLLTWRILWSITSLCLRLITYGFLA